MIMNTGIGIRWRLIRSALIVSGVCAAIGVAYFVGHFRGQLYEDSKRSEGELMRSISLLDDLNANDLNAARDRLNMDATVYLLSVLANCNFTTNKNVLVQRPGIRAAARVWGAGGIPDTPVIDADTRALIQQKLVITRNEMQRLRSEKTLK